MVKECQIIVQTWKNQIEVILKTTIDKLESPHLSLFWEVNYYLIPSGIIPIYDRNSNVIYSFRKFWVFHWDTCCVLYWMKSQAKSLNVILSLCLVQGGSTIPVSVSQPAVLQTTVEPSPQVSTIFMHNHNICMLIHIYHNTAWKKKSC